MEKIKRKKKKRKPLMILEKWLQKTVSYGAESYKWSNCSYLPEKASEFLMSGVKFANSAKKCRMLDFSIGTSMTYYCSGWCANPYLMQPFKWQLEILEIDRILEHLLIMCNI